MEFLHSDISLSPPPYLHLLPQALLTYVFARTSIPEDGGRCFVCQRDYGEQDSEGEEPCLPVLIASCGHLDGSQCVQELMRSILTKDCPFCRTKIEAHGAQPLPAWLTRLCSTWWFSRFCRLNGVNVTPRSEQLEDDLVLRRLTLLQAGNMLYRHIMHSLLEHISDSMEFSFIFITYYLSELVSWICSTKSPAVTLICGLVLCSLMFAGILHKDLQQGIVHGPADVIGMFAFMATLYAIMYNSALFIGFKGLLLLCTISWVAHCAIGGALIVHCAKDCALLRQIQRMFRT
jgi:hypothetical protein